MKLLRKMTAFILAFGLLAGTVAAASAEVSSGNAVSIENETIAEDNSPELISKDNTAIAATEAQNYTPRFTAPASNSKYYYSNLNPYFASGWGMPNCTCYAWGRAYEILGKRPKLSLNDAYLWFDYNKKNGYYKYGTTPKPGSIACWVYTSGISGHVAVVENVEDGVITFSNSAYSTKVNFYTSTAPVKDPSNGERTWIFQGYIYLGDYVYTSPETKPSAVGDVYRIKAIDGVNLRKGYSVKSNVLSWLRYGQDVVVTKTKKSGGYTWGYTACNGVKGWFVLNYAKLIHKKTAAAKTTSTENTTAAKKNLVTTAAKTTPTTAKTTPTANKLVTTAAKSTATTAKTTATTAKTTATTAKTSKTTETTQVKPTAAPSTTAPAASETETVVDDLTTPVCMLMMGDLDGDNELTIVDATRLQRIFAELIVANEYMLSVADFDGDSELSIMDAQCIMYYLAYLKQKA